MSFLNNLRLIPRSQFFCCAATAGNAKSVSVQSNVCLNYRIILRNLTLLKSVPRLKSNFFGFKFFTPSQFTFNHDLPSPSYGRQIVRTFFEPAGADINTNVSRDVTLFEYRNDRLFKAITFFATTQILLWGVVAYNCFTTLKDTPVVDDGHRELQWWEKVNLGENWVRNGITGICIGMGAGLFTFAYLITVRTVKFLILHRGGRKVSFITYGFLGENTLTVPLTDITCLVGRTHAVKHIPIKVRGRTLHYTLDKKGIYNHPVLFDWTAGLNRGWKK